jgi:hypothetical protein
VVHECQSLAFRLEAGDDLRRVHSGLDDLEGDLAMKGCGQAADRKRPSTTLRSVPVFSML